MQQLCKKISESAERLQRGGLPEDEADKLCGSVVRTARTLKDGVRKLQEKPGGEVLAHSVRGARERGKGPGGDLSFFPRPNSFWGR